jgi:hypothetical protein
MGKKFIARVPKKPIFKRATYNIPESYLDAYQQEGIVNPDKMVMLFHLTQFGGFRTKRDPNRMNFNQEFLETWFKQNKNYGDYHFKANANFLQKFGELELKPLEKRWKTKVLDPEEMREIGYSEKEINDSLVFLEALNDFYSSLRLGIELPQTGVTAKDRIQLSRFHGIPYLVKKPKAGGRFFHPETSYQRISSSLRPFITIYNERVSEIDISGATLQFFNISLRNHSLESLDGELPREDPYKYFLSVLNSEEILSRYDEEPTGREDLKEILYTAIYSSKGRQSANVNRKLRFMKRGYKHLDLTFLFPRFFNALTELKAPTNPTPPNSTEELPLHMIINREESKYAQEVLQIGCLENRLPILPIHDSFITNASNLRYLREIMDDVAKRLYGEPLTHKQKY